LDSPTFQFTSAAGLRWLSSARLASIPWLVHAFSTRRGGLSQPPAAGLNLGFTPSDQRELVEENRRRFYAELKVSGFAMAAVRQTHSSQSFIVERDQQNRLAYRSPGTETTLPRATDPPQADGLMTADPGVLLTIRIADCLPLLLVDPSRRIVAAVHAGWRGALARIVEKAIGDLRRDFGSDPRRLVAAIGPCIHACCYEVGQEVVEAFHGSFAAADSFFQPLPERSPGWADRHTVLFSLACPPGHAPEHVPAGRLDLPGVVRHQLLAAGLVPANIDETDLCTACLPDLFFSHRRDGGSTGRQCAAIGIREESTD